MPNCSDSVTGANFGLRAGFAVVLAVALVFDDLRGPLLRLASASIDLRLINMKCMSKFSLQHHTASACRGRVARECLLLFFGYITGLCLGFRQVGKIAVSIER